jgi:hypothetical protein
MRAADLGRFVTLVALALPGVVAGAVQTEPPTCPAGKEWPLKMRLEYDVTASRGPLSINGESVLTFERNGSAYSITVNTDSAVIYHARQTSRGTIDGSGLKPAEFVEVRGSRTPQTTSFDWDAKSVLFSANPDTPGSTSPGLQDRASLLLQLAWRHRTVGAESTFEVPVAGARRVGPYRFVSQGVETVKVPIGAVEALHIERANDEPDRLAAWFSTGWCGLPVRIRFTDRNGGVIDHRLRAARID